MRILITSIGGTLIPYLVKFLKQDTQLHNLYIVGIDKKKIKKNKYNIYLSLSDDAPWAQATVIISYN